MPIWLEPQADNGTPMDEAFERAARLSTWRSKWPNGFPPSVINITDGAANDPGTSGSRCQKGNGSRYRGWQGFGLQSSHH